MIRIKKRLESCALTRFAFQMRKRGWSSFNRWTAEGTAPFTQSEVFRDPKTESGIRYVPMSEEVVACFRRILANRVAPKVEPMVDGYAGFLFLDKNDSPMVALHWEKYLQHIVEKYNKIYRIQMPKVTPHVCRHTFCSNMAKSGMNPKTLQYIMGHSDISVTLNVYTHVQFDDAQAELLRVAEA